MTLGPSETPEAAAGTHLLELALGDAVAVEDDARGLEARGLVELNEQLADHGGQVLDDLLPVLLDPHRGAVAVGVRVHAAHDLHRRARTCMSPPQRHGTVEGQWRVGGEPAVLVFLFGTWPRCLLSTGQRSVL